MRRQRDASLSLHGCLLVAIAICAVVSGAPQSQATIEELLKDDDVGGSDTKVALVTLSASSSSEEDSASSSSREANVSDDLIFLARKTATQMPAAQQQEKHMEASSSSEELDEVPPTVAEVVPPIDMSAFVALIPARQVQAIVANYYRHDKEVQRAYAFLSSEFFAEMKQQILQLPEVLAFTRYLNASGLDVLKLTQTVVQATKATTLPALEPTDSTTVSAVEALGGVNGEPSSKELNGLHGLVDSVLDVLPQDQILATFFDKTETDQQFSRLIDSIGTPKFSKILSNLQNSVPIRNLIFELHNNGIYIARIVESLKAYFFLSSF
ncbi:protein G12 [Drosophila montana]|uniref:protein G12 n=1 Tax=Drosophila montana TaxID=40370 RepID=UPI00313B1BB6